MKNYITFEGFSQFVHKNEDSHVIALHMGNAVYYIAFIFGKAVAQFVDYNTKNT